MENTDDRTFWNDRYLNKETGWDIGHVSTPLKEYIDQLTNKNIRILIPGCGNSYEAEYLLKSGFSNITLVDISAIAVENLKTKFQENKEINVLNEDFFKHEGKYDLVLEQTFFCAINPSLRKEYVAKTHDLLARNGKLCGLMFNCDFDKAGPPFGGNTVAYEKLFEPYFEILTMEACHNSIAPRQGSEVFFIFRKKSA